MRVKRRLRKTSNELIREALTLVRVEVENQRVSICTELSAELPQVPANQVQLRQVIVNLVMNAIDAMSTVNRARVLRIKTETRKLNGVMITVEDSGTGIDPQNLDRIFDAFFTTKSHGMGMGLSICRSIIESHDGHLSAAPAEPYGSIFQVSLPTRSSLQNIEPVSDAQRIYPRFTMPVLGPKRRLRSHRGMSAFGRKADIDYPLFITISIL
jgi:C4-dicarboxylate-specific signal transduction histidine kinase